MLGFTCEKGTPNGRCCKPATVKTRRKNGGDWEYFCDSCKSLIERNSGATLQKHFEPWSVLSPSVPEEIQAEVSTPQRAADDFSSIRKRMEQIKREEDGL